MEKAECVQSTPVEPPTTVGEDEGEIQLIPPFIRLTLAATLTPIYISPDNVVCFYPALASVPPKGNSSKVVGIKATAVTGSIIVVAGADSPFSVTEHVDDIYTRIHGEPPAAD